MNYQIGDTFIVLNNSKTGIFYFKVVNHNYDNNAKANIYELDVSFYDIFSKQEYWKGRTITDDSHNRLNKLLLEYGEYIGMMNECKKINKISA